MTSEGEQRPSGTIEVLAHLAAKTASSDELTAWAVRALADGYDSPVLLGLASLAEVRLSDAEPLFRRALDDLGIAYPPLEQLLRAYARSLASRIADGRVSHQEGAHRIFHEVLYPLGYPSDLMGWYFLYDGTHYPTHRELRGAELDAVILEEAHKLLDRNES